MSSHPSRCHIFMNKLTNVHWKIIDLLAFFFDSFATSYYDKSIGSEYRKEYRTYHITSEDNVLHIGCGIFPLTEITLAQETNASIIGIDKDNTTIEKAQKAVHHYQLDDNINITHGSGEYFPLSQFSVIIISSCASPKINIINHVIKEMKPESKIIIREIESSAQLIFTFFDQRNDLSYCGSLAHNPFPFYSPLGWQSRCYQKK